MDSIDPTSSWFDELIVELASKPKDKKAKARGREASGPEKPRRPTWPEISHAVRDFAVRCYGPECGWEQYYQDALLMSTGWGLRYLFPLRHHVPWETWLDAKEAGAVGIRWPNGLEVPIDDVRRTGSLAVNPDVSTSPNIATSGGEAQGEVGTRLLFLCPTARRLLRVDLMDFFVTSAPRPCDDTLNCWACRKRWTSQVINHYLSLVPDKCFASLVAPGKWDTVRRALGRAEADYVAVRVEGGLAVMSTKQRKGFVEVDAGDWLYETVRGRVGGISSSRPWSGHSVRPTSMPGTAVYRTGRWLPALADLVGRAEHQMLYGRPNLDHPARQHGLRKLIDGVDIDTLTADWQQHLLEG